MARKTDKTIKLCVICGDKAKGINFNALTCMSCKAFFRRNALRNKELKCPFNDSCQVDKITRKFCSKCRLQKCFDVGMKKEWILSDEEKRLIKEKILRNRLRRQQQEMKHQSSPRQRAKSYDSRTESTASGSPSDSCNGDSGSSTSTNNYGTLTNGNRKRGHQGYKPISSRSNNGQSFQQNIDLQTTSNNGQTNGPNLSPLGSNYSKYFSNNISTVSNINGNNGTNGATSGLKGATGFSTSDFFTEPSAFSLDILLTSEDWDQFSSSSSLNSLYSDCGALTGNITAGVDNATGLGFLSKSPSSSLLAEDISMYDLQTSLTTTGAGGVPYRHTAYSALIDPKKDEFLCSPLNVTSSSYVSVDQQSQHQQQANNSYVGNGVSGQNLLFSSADVSEADGTIDLFEQTVSDDIETLSQQLSNDSGSDLYDDPLVVVSSNGESLANRTIKQESPEWSSNIVKILNHNQTSVISNGGSNVRSPTFQALTQNARDVNNNRTLQKSINNAGNNKLDFSQYLLHDSDPFTIQQQDSLNSLLLTNGPSNNNNRITSGTSNNSQQQSQQQQQPQPQSAISTSTGYSFQHSGDYCYMIPYDSLLSLEPNKQIVPNSGGNGGSTLKYLKLSGIEDCYSQIHQSGKASKDGGGGGYLGQFLAKTSNHDNSDEVISNYDPMIEMVPRLTTSMPPDYLGKFSGFSNRELIQSERCMIKELTDACTILKNPYKRIIYIASEMSHNCRITEFSIHRLIRMSKRLSAFNRLIQADQVELLKCGLIEMLGLRSVLIHDPDREAWKFLDDKCKITIVVNMQVIKSACINNDFQRHRQFPKRFMSEWKSDNIIFDLLTAIVLFTPRPGLIEKENVKEEYARYTNLLRRYLEVKYPNFTEAINAFNRLMSCLEENRILKEDIVQFFITTSKSYIHTSPLFAQLLESSNQPNDYPNHSFQQQSFHHTHNNPHQQHQRHHQNNSAPSINRNNNNDEQINRKMSSSSPTLSNHSTSTLSCPSPLLPPLSPLSPTLGLFDNCSNSSNGSGGGATNTTTAINLDGVSQLIDPTLIGGFSVPHGSKRIQECTSILNSVN